MDFEEILFEHWGYKSFRPMQKEVVQSVYDGNDTLALLPTGGGKSVCFQVPAMAREGLCLVVTPLIALMKDQVENLKKREIKAAAIFSGMTQREIDVALDNSKYGGCKFLYLSPERLATEGFREHLGAMNVNLLAIDESHCISQWGYDFRPSYLHIADVRELLPDVPVLALTATATPQVALDIMDKLRFKKRNLLQKSFERKNLTYVVRPTEDKDKELLKVARSVPGTAVVYVRTRRATLDTARFLQRNGLSADAYHGGMDSDERSAKQDAWKNGKTRIIVATNAFGMGIDKPDVRWVVHTEVPDSLEAYYQEAGRGGRDEKRAYGVLLYNQSDRLSAERRETLAFPPIDEIKRIYQALGSYFEIPVNTGINTVHDFNINDFCNRYKLSVINVFSALQFLQRDGYIEFSEEVNLPSRAMMIANREDLYRTQLKNPDLDLIIKALLRAYSGIFSQYVNIDEGLIARAVKLSVNKTCEALQRLTKMEVLSYLPRKKTPILVFTDNRLDEKNLRISKENYDERKKRYHERVEAMLRYAENPMQCRSQQLLAYFGELESQPCGHCDVCTQKNDLDIGKYEFDTLIAKISAALTEAPCSIDELSQKIDYRQDSKLIKVVRWLLDNEKVSQNHNGTLQWMP
ncbi:ATP-dependent DNA helicase RecQ [Bacteroidia bacterium]|nr:ATP-dependent DNA helicase RecQ [Bacteroidia bacterium]